MPGWTCFSKRLRKVYPLSVPGSLDFDPPDHIANIDAAIPILDRFEEVYTQFNV